MQLISNNVMMKHFNPSILPKVTSLKTPKVQGYSAQLDVLSTNNYHLYYLSVSISVCL